MSSCWSTCCVGELPTIRDVRLPVTTGRGQVFSSAMDPLIDALDEYTLGERAVIRSRLPPLIDSAEREAQRAEKWDARLFAIGFGGSLAVTIAAAINQSPYLSTTWHAVIGIAVVLMSSLGTAAVGLRERLKFKDKADVARRSSTRLQKQALLFVARAGPYACRDRSSAYRAFVRDVERLKSNADAQRQSLRDFDAGAGGGAAAGGGGGPDPTFATLGLSDSTPANNNAASLSMFGLPSALGGAAARQPLVSSVMAPLAAPPAVTVNAGRAAGGGGGGGGGAGAPTIPAAMGPGVMLAPTPQTLPSLPIPPAPLEETTTMPTPPLLP